MVLFGLQLLMSLSYGNLQFRELFFVSDRCKPSFGQTSRFETRIVCLGTSYNWHNSKDEDSSVGHTFSGVSNERLEAIIGRIML